MVIVERICILSTWSGRQRWMRVRRTEELCIGRLSCYKMTQDSKNARNARMREKAQRFLGMRHGFLSHLRFEGIMHVFLPWTGEIVDQDRAVAFADFFAVYWYQLSGLSRMSRFADVGANSNPIDSSACCGAFCHCAMSPVFALNASGCFRT